MSADPTFVVPSVDVLALGATLIACGVMGAILFRACARELPAGAYVRRHVLGQQLEVRCDADWMQAVQRAVFETHGCAGEITRFQHIVQSRASWMSFCGHADRVYVISTQAIAWPGAPRGRRLRGAAGAELDGQMSALWRHFSSRAWRMGNVPDNQTWHVFVTERRAMMPSVASRRRRMADLWSWAMRSVGRHGT